MKIKYDITPEQYTAIEERRSEMPGVVLEVQPLRAYPLGDIAAHVLGYMGEINEQQLQAMSDQGYRIGDFIGQSGLERYLEQELHGRAGGRQVEIDALGRLVRELGVVEPVPGNDAILTIDAALQQRAEYALQATLFRRQAAGFEDARAGAAVVLDVRTGEILAMVSEPDFNPNDFVTGIPLAKWRELNTDPASPMVNRAIKSSYPPASTFKMVTAAAALEEGVSFPGETFDARGGIYRVTANEVRKCWYQPYGGHGIVDIPEALAKSCNIAFYELGRRLFEVRNRTDSEVLARYARMFGLGEATGLKSLPGEEAGRLPDSANKVALFGDANIYLGDYLNLAIGQGFMQYTPLQMARYVAAIANGGLVYRPYLVKEIRSPSGEIVTQTEPEVVSRLEVSPRTLKTLQLGMYLTTVLETDEGYGTAYGIFESLEAAGIAVAGKTGTVQLGMEDVDNHGWFVGYAPADPDPFDDIPVEPEIALAVIVEHGGGGAAAAAPVAREIFEYYFRSRLPESPSPPGLPDQIQPAP